MTLNIIIGNYELGKRMQRYPIEYDINAERFPVLYKLLYSGPEVNIINPSDNRLRIIMSEVDKTIKDWPHTYEKIDYQRIRRLLHISMSKKKRFIVERQRDVYQLIS